MDNFRKKSQQHWKKMKGWQKRYRRGMSSRYQAMKRLGIEKIIPLLSSDDVIADVGCADGWFSALLAPYVKSLEGFDISPNLIKEARKSTIKNASFSVCDLIDEELPKASYDHVVCMGVFTCIQSDDDIKNILNKIKASFKSPGYLILKDSVWLKKSSYVWETEKKAMKYRTLRDYESIFEEVGFKIHDKGWLGKANKYGTARSGFFICKQSSYNKV